MSFPIGRARANSAPVPTNPETSQTTREPSRPSREEQGKALESRMTAWARDSRDSEENTDKLRVKNQVLKAFNLGEDSVTLPAKYSGLFLPHDLPADFQIKLATEEVKHAAAAQIPRPRESVSEDKLRASRYIQKLRGIEGDDKFENACRGTLDIVRKVDDQADRAQLLWELTTQVSTYANSHPTSRIPGKIFSEQLLGAAQDFKVQINANLELARALEPLTLHLPPPELSTLDRVINTIQPVIALYNR